MKCYEEFVTNLPYYDSKIHLKIQHHPVKRKIQLAFTENEDLQGALDITKKGRM